jgi:ATP-dependent Lhr-like helicase
VFSFLQRAGRSGQPEESIIYFLATHAMELVKPRHSKAAAETIVEDRIPYLNSYDVLIQYQIRCSDGFFSDVIYKEVQKNVLLSKSFWLKIGIGF